MDILIRRVSLLLDKKPENCRYKAMNLDSEMIKSSIFLFEFPIFFRIISGWYWIIDPESIEFKIFEFKPKLEFAYNSLD